MADVYNFRVTVDLRIATHEHPKAAREYLREAVETWGVCKSWAAGVWREALMRAAGCEGSPTHRRDRWQSSRRRS